VSIERTATVLGVEQLRPAVGPALVARGLPPGADFAFDNPALKVMVPTGGDPSVAVEQMTYDGRQRFVATLVIGDDPATAERLRLTGRVFQTIDAVVLTRPIQPGDVIRARDLEVIRVRAEQAGAAVIRDPARMIGRTVRRTLLAGQPIRGQDLAPVLWVQRNSLVTVKVDSSRIAIAMQGKALDDGAEGDRVRVINTRSDKTIQGIVTGPGEVTVQSVYAIATR
jgi:flagella basal body P-ring formation protein FlgA